MKLLIVRHGESIDDIEDRYGGWADYSLTEKGKAQVAESAEKISSLNEGFEVILTSPLKRAFEAAQIISYRLGLDVEVFEYLKERNLNGILTGLVRTEAKEKYPDQVKAHSNYEYVDGSEREDDFIQRVGNAKRLLTGMKYNSMITVTHGLFMKTFCKEVMGLDIAKVGNGGFVFVEEVNNTYKILKEEGIEYGQ